MKRRYKILIGIAIAAAVGLTVHFGGRAIVDWVVAMHS